MKFLLVLSLFYNSCISNVEQTVQPSAEIGSSESISMNNSVMLDINDTMEDLTLFNDEESDILIVHSVDNGQNPTPNNLLKDLEKVDNPVSSDDSTQLVTPAKSTDLTEESIKEQSIKEVQLIENEMPRKDDKVATNYEDVVSGLPMVSIDLAEDSRLDHSIFDEILQKYVTSTGYVNYTALRANRSRLNSYLETISSQVPHHSWYQDESLAYWINVYNAYTIDLILSHYPVNSIMDIDNGNPWEVKRITLSGQKYSLNQIEHEIIRPRFQDARIHFAVNCAAMSCPKLHNRAMTAANLHDTLDRLTREFVNNTEQNTVSSGAAELSKIFEWYALDFGNIHKFINNYTAAKLHPNATISYKTYNWKLNGR